MKEETLRLVHKAIKGSNTAYGELIAEYQVYLYKTAFLYLKNEADSLDAVQECVTRGLLGIKKLEVQGDNAEVYSTYGRNTDVVYVYVCGYAAYMNELKGDDQKIAEGALFGTKVQF